MQWKNVRVLQLRYDLDFVEKALRPYCPGKLRVEYFEGDKTVMPAVLCKVDRGHAAAAELPLDHVAIAQGVVEAQVDCGHSTAWARMTRRCRK